MSAAEHTAHGQDRPPDEHLAVVVQQLSDRIEALQADVRRLGGPGLPVAEPGWESEEQAVPPTPSYAWVSSIPAPVRRRPGVPRLLLEVLFLAAVAAAAAIARLEAAQIAAVMAGAWVLVALIEWAASRAERRRDAIPGFYAQPAPPEPASADPAWFVPPVEHTLVEPGGDSPTAVTRLPPPIEQTVDIDATVEGRPEDLD
jgi:hypothetical protein